MAELVRITVRRVATERSIVQYLDWGGDTRCGLWARYARASDRWWLWLVALDGTTIATLGPAVPGVDLLLGHKHDPRVPQGQLFVYSPDRLPPDADTVDSTSVLYYRRAADVVTS